MADEYDRMEVDEQHDADQQQDDEDEEAFEAADEVEEEEQQDEESKESEELAEVWCGGAPLLDVYWTAAHMWLPCSP